MAQQIQGEAQWVIPPADFSGYYTYYHRVTPPGVLLSGSRAREFFLQTKLPPQTLSQIWKLADLDQDGCLNSAEFAVAMHLIRVVLRDHTPVPTTCPTPLQAVVRQSLYPQLPVATLTHLDKCKKAFGAFFENIGQGVLGGDAARYLMLKSNLPKPQLFHIWKLSDMDGDGRLSFLEFTVAMHLIYIAKLGYTLPVDLDPNTIIPSTFYEILQEVQSRANQSPKVTPTSDSPEPFSPPATPANQTLFFEDNPFVSDAFINLPARQFREGQYGDFVGDPFETINPFSNKDNHCVDVNNEDFVDSTTPNEVFENGRHSATSDSGLSQGSEVSPERQRDSQYKVSNPTVPVKAAPSTVKPSAPLDCTKPPQSSRTNSNKSIEDIQTSTKDSLPQNQTISTRSLEEDHVHTSSRESWSRNSPCDKLSSPTLSQDLPHPQSPLHTDSLGNSPDHSNLSQQSGHSRLSQVSGFSTTSPQSRSECHSQLSSTVSFQEMVVEERIEPMLQQACSVDVVGSREATPVLEGGRSQLQPPALVSDELESLSRASRRFVEESQSKLEEQQRRNHIAPEQSHQASLRGLSTTTLDIQAKTTTPSQCLDKATPTDDVDYDDVDYDALEAEEVMSQLDDLEAEMMSTLEDSDFEVDDIDDEDLPQEDLDVGALYLEYHDDREATPVDDSTTTVSDDLLSANQKETTPTHRDTTPTRQQDTTAPVNGVSVSNGVSWRTIREEQMKRKSQLLEATMDELNNFLGDELADIDDMFQEFQTKDKQEEEKRRKEELDLKHRDEEIKLKEEAITVHVPDGDTAESVEKITKRREDESQKLAQEWEKEMEQLKAQRLTNTQRHSLLQEVESDSMVQSLDAQLQELIKHEEEELKVAQREKELLAIKEKEEAERRERERKEKLMNNGNKEEMTIEEWIEWMEEKKKAGMTPEQLAELERRKANWVETQRLREEKRKREEEEQLEKTRKKMETELRAFRERDKEIKSTRLTVKELEAKKREKALKDAQESEQRKERSRQLKERIRQQELENLKPKAQSTLAARWEERIRARSEGKVTREENKATVLSGSGMNSLKREQERISRRITNGPRPLSTSSNEGEPR